jgi:hypothetical protein
MINTIKDMNGIPFFTIIELTKLSESVGRFLLLTTKDKLESDKRALNTFFEMMAAKGTMNKSPVTMNESPEPTL